MDVQMAINILNDFKFDMRQEGVFKVLSAITVVEKQIKELEEQNEVLSDTVNMLSPLMMENKKLKEEVMEWKVKAINLEQERLSELY